MNNNEKKILTELKKAHGMAGKIIHMIESNEPSINIMRNNLTTVRFLKLVQKSLMQEYFELCFNNGIMSKSREVKKKMTKEILKATDLLNR